MILYDIEHDYMVVLFFIDIYGKRSFVLKVVANEIEEMFFLFAFEYCLKGQRNDGRESKFLTYFFSRS